MPSFRPERTNGASTARTVELTGYLLAVAGLFNLPIGASKTGHDRPGALMLPGLPDCQGRPVDPSEQILETIWTLLLKVPLKSEKRHALTARGPPSAPIRFLGQIAQSLQVRHPELR